MTGRVFAHVGVAFEPPGPGGYDFAVVGGGRMGLAAAFYLKKFHPHASVLIVEREGIPSEGGLTSVARGVWTLEDVTPEWWTRALWTRGVWVDPEGETETRRPYDPKFQEVTVWTLDPTESPSFTSLKWLSPEERSLALDLIDFDPEDGLAFDDLGGYGSATTLALSYGYGAVRLGADLMLNTEASLTEHGVELRRLDVTPTMEVVVAQTLHVPASRVIVAAGSEGPALLERDLGVVTPHGRAFVQFPRLEVSPPPGFPVLRAKGFTLRPGEGVVHVLPPVRGPDPAGYEPVGGRLVGVPVGVRRELLDDLLEVLDDVPAFAGERLNLGKVVGDVPGAWEARPRGGWPLWEHVSPSVSLVLGGPNADLAGPAVALDLAATLAGVRERPW